ncbi:tetratricopeptide repeat protein [Haloplasma contractile]|uniref:Uncharacterized protein n=1 Tax=Haloplasma contractile SSD-17B TaxID=1033810 RepID=F7PU01_9MOLU|nr:tetratricopeptide repeat protein [Haloplasma contractile]ERJ12178.1 hypothetical protein HLPCO_001705 [Haloplasma contractile SSD-17B]
MRNTSTKLVVILIGLVIMAVLRTLEVNVYLSGILTFIIILFLFFGINIRRNLKLINLLNKKCDPPAFLDYIERTHTGKNMRYKLFIEVTKAGGLIANGQFEEAETLLSSMDEEDLAISGVKPIHTINLTTCLYELGKIREAEQLFTAEIPVDPQGNESLLQSITILKAVRFFHLKRYAESKELFNAIKREGIMLNKIDTVMIEYKLGMIDQINGDSTAALNRFKYVADEGNLLWVAKKAKLFIEEDL